MSFPSAFSPELFRGRHVFITGGSSGINLGVAQAFARHGASVSICGRSLERLHSARARLEETGAEVFAQSADVRDYAAVEAALTGAREAFGDIDVLVCGAAGNFMCPAEALSPNGFKSVIDIDLVGSFHATRAAFEQLQRSRGNVIFISAGQAFTPFMHQLHVGAAKAGIDNMMRNLALEWGRFGIRSNSIVPGFIGDTEGTRRMAGSRAMEAIQTATPLERLGQVEDIGNMALFLASPLAAYVSGLVAVVDGGHYLGGSSLFNQAWSAQEAA